MNKPNAQDKGEKSATTDAGAPSSAKPAADAGAPVGGGELPSGHPPVDTGLPAGHPSVGSGDDDDDEAPASPHGGMTGPDPRIFRAPPDTAEDDATLPVGTIVVTIKDAQDKPIPRAPITLGILYSSVAKGDSSERRAVEADNEGRARFDGLTFGSSTTYRITTERGPASYSLMPFPLGDGAGKRAVLHSYDISPSIDGLPVGAQAVVYIALREDSIQVEQIFNIFNLGAVAWVADAPFALPAGFKAFNKQDTMSDARVDEVKGTGAALRGTFPPGRRDINFRYQVPLDNESQQTLKIELPPHVAQGRVIAESSKSMSLSVSGFPPPERTTRENKRLLFTERQMARAEGGVPMFEITLSGLPTPGPGRWIALLMAMGALFAGVTYYLQKSDGSVFDPDARADLVEAREALLAEIVALERAHKKGEVGPKTYARIRAALVDSLARIVTMLDAARAEEKRRRRGARPAASTS
jgi:hypothetical protein